MTVEEFRSFLTDHRSTNQPESQQSTAQQGSISSRDLPVQEFKVRTTYVLRRLINNVDLCFDTLSLIPEKK